MVQPAPTQPLPTQAAPSQAADAAALAAIAAARNAPIGTAPAAPPTSTQPGFASVPAPARQTPSYADPRLNGSGTVREEYRNSGSAITR
jgi:hypothetical protein